LLALASLRATVSDDERAFFASINRDHIAFSFAFIRDGISSKRETILKKLTLSDRRDERDEREDETAHPFQAASPVCADLQNQLGWPEVTK